MKSLYRVDAQLRTIKFVEKLPDHVKVNVWFMGLIGDGYYAYVEAEEKAKELLVRTLEEEIVDIKSLIKELKDETI